MMLIIFNTSSISKMNGGIDKSATKKQITYDAHNKKQLSNIGINLTNESINEDIFACAEKSNKTRFSHWLCINKFIKPVLNYNNDNNEHFTYIKSASLY